MFASFHTARLSPWIGMLLLIASLPARSALLSLQIRDGQGQALADAVVAVEVKGERRSAAPGTLAQMAQREREFLPGLLVIQTGSLVNFPNFDTVRHHVYSLSPIKTFELKLYSGTPSAPVLFDKPGVAVLGCNIHDRMSAYIVVVDTPHFARSDARGQVQLELPAGEHQLKAWHAGMGPQSPMLSQVLTLTPGGSSAVLSLPLK